MVKRMIKIENAEVLGWEHAIRGMRNPMNSWDKSDSCMDYVSVDAGYGWIGENDLSLMTKLRNAGTDHRKFMRMITVYVDITAPFYWWKEYDTYKVSTVANSCSTMHTIHKKPLSVDDFSHEHLTAMTNEVLISITNVLNLYMEEFKRTGDKEAWWQIIQLLPTSFNQKRTVMLNYEVLANMYKSRKDHKLDEWMNFCSWAMSLPYAKELICGESNRLDRETV
jgi:hypothetical protein